MKELIDMLTEELGVSAAQAEGGAAVLFKAAKDKLGGDGIRQAAGRRSRARRSHEEGAGRGGGGLGGLLGGLAGAMGGNAALISTIVGGFGKLGLTAEDAKTFVPVMLDFLQHQGRPGRGLQTRKDPARLNSGTDMPSFDAVSELDTPRTHQCRGPGEPRAVAALRLQGHGRHASSSRKRNSP